ncbi:MAG: hypothetical protein JRH20_16890 [Deltaproteobacteria bacterium]|nr:hypothetical protein [Deltaproteobacteria bacterium]
MSATRQCTVAAVLLVSACTTQDTPLDGGAANAENSGDLHTSRGLEVLVIAPYEHDSATARAYLSATPARLLSKLLEDTELNPQDIRLGVVSTVVEGKSVCDSQPPPPGTLLTGPSGAALLTGEAGSDLWARHVQSGQGSPECWNPHYLEVATLALDGRNGDFPRPDALLVVLVLNSLDDCSIDDYSLWDQPAVWSPEKIRFTTKCYLPPQGFLFPVQRYPEFFVARHPGRVFVAAISWPTKPSFTTDPSGYTVIANGKCSDQIWPAPRMAEFIDAVRAHQDPRLQGSLYDMGCDPSSADIASLAGAIIDHGRL